MSKTTKPKAQTKAELWHQEVRKSVPGKEAKQAVDEFVGAIDALIAAFGKKDAMALYAKCGVLVTLARETKV